MYRAEIILDSVAPSGARLTTFEVEYPRFIHAQVLMHRAFSRSIMSSRAMPAKRFRTLVEEDPAMPIWWGKNQKGMQADEELTGAPLEAAKQAWLEGLEQALETHRRLEAIGLHKQICNRVLEPWLFIRAVISSTEFANFFFLRIHDDAQKELTFLAKLMRECYLSSKPQELEYGRYHLPYIMEDERRLPETTLKMISAARCARVSYLNHDGKREIEKDLDLHDRLLQKWKNRGTQREPQHLNPFEHPAMALAKMERSGNIVGFRQYRKEVEVPPPPIVNPEEETETAAGES